MVYGALYVIALAVILLFNYNASPRRDTSESPVF